MCIYSPMPHTLSYCALIGKCALIRSNTVFDYILKIKVVSFQKISELHYIRTHDNARSVSETYFLGWLVGCFGFNGPLRQYFSLYKTVSQREGERGEKGKTRVKMSKQPPPAPTASTIGPCPTVI